MSHVSIIVIPMFHRSTRPFLSSSLAPCHFFMLLPAIFWSSAKVVTRLSSYPYLLLAACMHASALQSRCRAARASACGRSFLDGCWPSYSHTLVPLPPFFSIPHPRALQCLRLCIVNRWSYYILQKKKHWRNCWLLCAASLPLVF